MKKIIIYLMSFIIVTLNSPVSDAEQISFKGNRLTEISQHILDRMTLEQKVGQVLMPAIPGKTLTARAKRILKKYKPGGVLFFGFNIGSAATLRQFTGDLQDYSMRIGSLPMFISIDQEGGRVYRVRDGVTLFPGNMAAGMANDAGLVRKWGRIIGLQLRSLGINMNLAPVLDINNNPENPVINSRSFGSDAYLVARMGSNYIKGCQESHCMAVGKHFPGHGDTNKDSHSTLPVINYTLERLKKVEFIPFVEAINYGLDGVMTAHIAYPKILHNMQPATVSKFFLHDVLRRQMNFDGLVLSDDLEMQAISKRHNIGSAAVNSIKAGVDIVLISTFKTSLPVVYSSVMQAVKTGRLSAERLDAAVMKILKMKLKYNIIRLKDKTVSYKAYRLTESDRTVLEEAHKVNMMLSRQAISFYGNRDLLKNRDGKKFILVSRYSGLRQVAQKGGITTLNSFNRFFRLPVSPGKKKTVLFAHFTKRDTRMAQKVVVYCKKKNIRLIAVSTDNPYAMVQMAKFPAMLFSYSNTPESIRQLGLCMTGEFEPGRNSGLLPGIR